VHSQVVQRDRTLERPYDGPAEFSPLKLGRVPCARTSQETARRERAVVVESQPAVQAVLEHALLREGYAVETFRGTAEAASEQAPEQGLQQAYVPISPVLVLVGAGSGEGLYVFRTRDVTGVMAALAGDAGLETPGVVGVGRLSLPAFGIHAFVPKPFGITDVLRVVRAIGGFDERKKGPPRRPPFE
jgi:CheY-like chemotaxis protein